MTWYDFLKFMHVSSAVIWVGGAAMFQFFALRAMAAGRWPRERVSGSSRSRRTSPTGDRAA